MRIRALVCIFDAVIVIVHRAQAERGACLNKHLTSRSAGSKEMRFGKVTISFDTTSHRPKALDKTPFFVYKNNKKP